MNNQEVIMHSPLPTTGLIAHSKALEAAGIAISLVLRVPAPLKSLADQVIRSASSVPANLSEGHGRSGRDRMHHWRIAYGSAKETDTHLRLLVGAGAIGVVAGRPIHHPSDHADGTTLGRRRRTRRPVWGETQTETDKMPT